MRDEVRAILFNMKTINSDQIISKPIQSRKFQLTKKDLNKFALGEFIAGYIEEQNIKITNFVGGAASGKNTIVQCIIKKLPAAESIDLDDFSVGKTREERNKIRDCLKKTDRKKLEEIVRKIFSLKPGGKLKTPEYDTVKGIGIYSQLKRIIEGPIKYLIIQGIFPGVKKPGLRIYFHLSDKKRLQNRLKRDMIERGYKNRGEIIKSFQSRQKIEHFPYTLPEAEKSDILILAKNIKGGKFTFDVFLR